MGRLERDLSKAAVLVVCSPLVWRLFDMKFVPGGVFSCVLYGSLAGAIPGGDLISIYRTKPGACAQEVPWR